MLFTPDSDELRYLPEGPYAGSDGSLSWVAIQHGATATTGSLNLLDCESGRNRSFDLPGRPGFAFPTDRPGVYVLGAEHSLVLFDTATGDWNEFVTGIDDSVTGTIINDGMVWDGNLIFGCKDLEFSAPKAGLYLWRAKDQALVTLRTDQVCSNGKAVIESDGVLNFFDIDTPAKTITCGVLDIEKGTLTDQQVIVDLTAEDGFPDGMILTPDRQSLIVAIYNPNDAPVGEARQYSLATGELQHVWECPGASQVTCPQLISSAGGVDLVLTTAVEHLPPERRGNQPNVGSLFVGPTTFTSIGDQPVFSVGNLL